MIPHGATVILKSTGESIATFGRYQPYTSKDKLMYEQLIYNDPDIKSVLVEVQGLYEDDVLENIEIRESTPEEISKLNEDLKRSFEDGSIINIDQIGEDIEGKG